MVEIHVASFGCQQIHTQNIQLHTDNHIHSIWHDGGGQLSAEVGSVTTSRSIPSRKQPCVVCTIVIIISSRGFCAAWPLFVCTYIYNLFYPKIESFFSSGLLLSLLKFKQWIIFDASAWKCCKNHGTNVCSEPCEWLTHSTSTSTTTITVHSIRIAEMSV